MAGLSVRLPEELRAPSERRENTPVERPGEDDTAQPVILRWFETWASGALP